METKKTRFTLTDLFNRCTEHVRTSRTSSCSCTSKSKPATKQPEKITNCSQAGGCSCSSSKQEESPAYEQVNSVFDKPVNRRQALGMIMGGTAASTALASTGLNILSSDEKREKTLLKWEEYFKGNFQVMNDQEKTETIQRLERLAKLEKGIDLKIKGTKAQQNVLYGYAFNISKCKGYRNCVDACIKENNLDRKSGMQYIRIFEMENGKMDLDSGDAEFYHQVPAEGHFYMGTQCFQCGNPPCVSKSVRLVLLGKNPMVS